MGTLGIQIPVQPFAAVVGKFLGKFFVRRKVSDVRHGRGGKIKRQASGEGLREHGSKRAKQGSEVARFVFIRCGVVYS